jgi:hypothetical protein
MTTGEVVGISEVERAKVARDAARRYLTNEHRVLLRTLDKRHVEDAVQIEACGTLDPDQVDDELIRAAIEQIKAVRVSYTWDGEQPACSAEPDALGIELGCKPCSLPAGHDGHRYPYPMPLAPGLPGYACARCGSLFTSPGEPRDEHSRHAGSACCRGCIDRCHEGNDGHRCVICTPGGAQ